MDIKTVLHLEACMSRVLLMALLVLSSPAFAEDYGRFVVKTIEYTQLTPAGPKPVKELVKIDSLTGEMWALTSSADIEITPGTTTFNRIWDKFEYLYTVPKDKNENKYNPAPH